MTDNEAAQDWPRVMLAMPVKNDAKWLPACLAALLEMEYPHEKLRFVFVYGPSIDGTKEVIEKSCTGTDIACEILDELEIPRTKSATYLAGTMNLLQDQLRDEDYILYADADVIGMPRHLLKELVSANKDIIAPCPMMETEEGQLVFYDTYVFRDLRGKDFTAVQRNPRHPWLEKKDPVEMMSIGTLGLVKRRVAEEVRWDNPVPWLQYCLNARKKGFRVWALPFLRVLHANVQTEGSHVRLEEYVRRGVLPSSELKKTQTLGDLPLLQERASSYARRALHTVVRAYVCIMRRYPLAAVLIRNLKRRQQVTRRKSRDM